MSNRRSHRSRHGHLRPLRLPRRRPGLTRTSSVTVAAVLCLAMGSASRPPCRARSTAPCSSRRRTAIPGARNGVSHGPPGHQLAAVGAELPRPGRETRQLSGLAAATSAARAPSPRGRSVGPASRPARDRDFFSLVGAPALHGRLITPADDRLGRPTCGAERAFLTTTSGR